MINILVVDDDSSIRQLLRHFLEREGYKVIEAEDGQDALHQCESTNIDIAILDVMMPGLDGYQLCQAIREQYDIPMLMLTAKGETAQKVKGFEHGTDDYLVKPFDPPELIARVKALLKRYRKITSHRLQLGKVILDAQTFECRIADQLIALPMKEFELLFKLMGYPNKTFTRDQLIEDLWGMDFDGNERTIDVHINRLRERLDEAQTRVKICTVRGLGYRMVALDV